MFKPPQVTLNGAHCIAVEYDGVKAAVAAGSTRRTRVRDNGRERPHSFPSTYASRPAPKVGESRGTYDFILKMWDVRCAVPRGVAFSFQDQDSIGDLKIHGCPRREFRPQGVVPETESANRAIKNSMHVYPIAREFCKELSPPLPTTVGVSELLT